MQSLAPGFEKEEFDGATSTGIRDELQSQ